MVWCVTMGRIHWSWRKWPQSSMSSFKVGVTEIHSLCSNQEETDTRIVIYLHYAKKFGLKSAVVCSPDSDVFFILLHHAHMTELTIFLDTGMGKHRTYRGKGKVMPLKKASEVSKVSPVSEWVIKFNGLSGDSGQRGPYNPCNHSLYIGIIIFPHIDNTQSTSHN